MFCAPSLVLGGTECVGSRFHVLCDQTHFRRYQGRRVPFSYFARPDTFSAVTRASGFVFMFCAPGLVFDGTEDVGYRFLVLSSRTHLRRFRYRRVPFSYYAHSDMSSAVPRASCLIFMFYAPQVVSRGTEGVGSRFHVLRSLIILGGTEGVGSRFHVLRSPTHFWSYRGRRVPFSCFARSDSFSAVPRASGPVFMFCAPGHVFGGTEVVGYRFHVLRSRTRFRLY
jgi:hypothetical protein